jgi:ankyrin repeat protein
MDSEQTKPGIGSSEDADDGVHTTTQPLVPSPSEAKPDETTEKSPEKTREAPKLITAIKERNRAAIRALLDDESVDPNAIYEDQTPFTLAITTSDPDIVQMFLDSKRVNHNAQDERGHIPLEIAVDSGSVEIIQKLLESDNIDPNLRRPTSWTTYTHALRSASPEIFQMFLKSDRIVHRIDDVLSPLGSLMSNDDQTTFKVLINKYKTFPETIRNNNATNALLRTVLYNSKNPKWVEMVFENDLIEDPLVIAVQKNDLDAIKALLTTSIQAETQNCESSIYTALMLALHQHKPNIVKELIKDKRINVNNYDHFIIEYAIDKGDHESAIELLKNNDSQGPLTTAVNNNNLDTLKDLLTGNFKRLDFQLALMQAVIDKKLNIVEELSKHKNILSNSDIYLDAARVLGHDDIFNTFAGSYDKNQRILKSKIVTYLRSQKRPDYFIDTFAGYKGFCWALSNLWLYGKWLQTQPKRPLLAGEKEKPRDDNDRFNRTVNMIVNWDEKRELSTEEKAEFEQIIAKLVFHQSMPYQSGKHSQVDIDSPPDWLKLAKSFPEPSLEDTVMAGKEGPKRALIKEFSFGSIFTLDSLELFLSTKGVIQDRRLIFVNTPNHATALFKEGNDYYYFNPNSPVGEVKCQSVRQISELIFNMAKSVSFEPIESHDGINAGLGFNMFSFDKYSAEKYPSPAEVLDKMRPPLYTNNSPPYWGLTMAVDVNSPKTAAYFINKILIEEASPPLPEPLTKENLKRKRISLITSAGSRTPIIAAQLALWNKIDECTDNEVKKFYQTLFNNSRESAEAFLDNLGINTRVKLDVFEEAMKIQNSEIVETFLKSDKISHEVKIEMFNKAVQNKNLEIVKIFLDWDKLDTKDIEFECYLAAACKDTLPIEPFLESNKIDPNTVFKDHTLLTSAIYFGKFSSVNALLDDPRVNPTLRNPGGKSPLEIAKEKGNKEIIDRLSAAITAWEVKSQASISRPAPAPTKTTSEETEQAMVSGPSQ